MSTTEEQIALLNKEKQINNDEIDFQNKQIEGLNAAINESTRQQEQYNVQINYCNDKINTLTSDNAILDEIIVTLGG